MIPKISVRPAASMNSSRPYCTLLSSWSRKLEKSMGAGLGGAPREQQQGGEQREQPAADAVDPPHDTGLSQPAGEAAEPEGAGHQHQEVAEHEGQRQDQELRKHRRGRVDELRE